VYKESDVYDDCTRVARLDKKPWLLLEIRRVIYPRQKVSRPCTMARETLASDVALSRSRELQYRKIAALDLPWQRRLDELGASLHHVRWVSGPGPGERRTEVDLRLRAMIKFLEGKSEYKSFRELRDSRPTFDPYSGEEIKAKAET
jgi:hypothetical protein